MIEVIADPFPADRRQLYFIVMLPAPSAATAIAVVSL
jgi:hypothetical protein